jgi:RHS repeat-associated protein
MPHWWVDEPYVNLWLTDEPLGYQPAQGDRISLALNYNQQGMPAPTNAFNLGPLWGCSWLSCVYDVDSNGVAGQYLPGGGGAYSNVVDGVTPQFSNWSLWSRLTDTNGNLSGFLIKYANGGRDLYGYVVTNSGPAYALLTIRVNAFGRTNQFIYTTNGAIVQLEYLIDADGHTNTLHYSSVLSPALLTEVDDPFGRHASFGYSSGGVLTNITDTAGMSSFFVYDTTNEITSLITPYGTTSFQYTAQSADGYVYGGDNIINRSILITYPDNGNELYMYRDTSFFLDTNHTTYLIWYTFSGPQVPTNTPIGMMDNTAVDNHDSFHWNRQQYAALSTNNMYYFTTNDYNKAHLSHWLIYQDFGTSNNVLSRVLSIERDPSPDPDGMILGQMTWYDYWGKYDTFTVGTNAQPDAIARMLPDGSTWYTYYIRNQKGYATNIISTYSGGLRTNIMVYATNGIDLIAAYGPDGVRQMGYSYNTNHQVLTMTNAVGDVTSFTYNSNGQVTSQTTPAGLTTTNIYFTSGLYQGWLATNIDLQINRTNSYTYTNGLVYSHTDERGLTTTNTWDSLSRLVSVTYPDSTTVSNCYFLFGGATYSGGSGSTNILDCTATKDRLGIWTYFAYDSLRHLIAVTNALNHVTQYAYCNCGTQLGSVTDALTNITLFTYDLDGRRITTTFPDLMIVTNNYDLVGRLTNVCDDAGDSITNWFDVQGLLVAQSNYFGQVRALAYDINDRPTNSVDANGVGLTNSFDNLGRIMSRQYPDGGVESFVYSNWELIRYTNQLAYVTFYAYDAAMRKTAETNANSETNGFTYNAAGDLLTLSDGKGQITTWHYDQLGRVTNKMDAASNTILVYKYDADDRLTNRHSISKGDTYYSYDAVGNLTSVSYSDTNHSLSLAYDADNRLTNMIDGIGATSYAYDGVGQLLSEGGLWQDDTVSYTYNNRLRSSVSVQQPDADSWTQTYAYDNARRLTNTTSPAGIFGYTYDAIRNMQVGVLSLPNGASITNSYDGNARLLATVLITSGNSILNSHFYTYNIGNQRLQQTFTAGNFDIYTYDRIGQLTNAAGYESDRLTQRINEKLHYTYDAAHNLNVRIVNGLVEILGCNNLNELTNYSHTGNMTVEGTTGAAATSVTINGSSAAVYSDNTFAEGGFVMANGNNSFTAIASDSLGRHSTNIVTVYLTAFSSYSYDLNGNLLYDGLRAFAYDDENQLTSVLVSNAWQSQFVYDGKMRRRIRKEFTWSAASSSWIQTNEVHYIYDGNVVVQERDINNLPVTTYTRGDDFSGSLQGEGGIGGMLAMSQPSTVNPQHYYYHADGNGNITAMVNGQQIIVAKYLYDPFGNTLALAGPLAGANLYRFSSKEFAPNSGLVAYLYRFYDPHLERWLNRDPVLENGGINLYEFAFNDPDDSLDRDGYDVVVNTSGSVAPMPTRSPMPTAPNPRPVPLPQPKPPSGPFGPRPIVPAPVLAACIVMVPTSASSGDQWKTESCHKTSDGWDPTTERRVCTFRCQYSEDIITREGDDCNKKTIYRVVPPSDWLPPKSK